MVTSPLQLAGLWLPVCVRRKSGADCLSAQLFARRKTIGLRSFPTILPITIASPRLSPAAYDKCASSAVGSQLCKAIKATMRVRPSYVNVLCIALDSSQTPHDFRQWCCVVLPVFHRAMSSQYERRFLLPVVKLKPRSCLGPFLQISTFDVDSGSHGVHPSHVGFHIIHVAMLIALGIQTHVLGCASITSKLHEGRQAASVCMPAKPA